MMLRAQGAGGQKRSASFSIVLTPDLLLNVLPPSRGYVRGGAQRIWTVAEVMFSICVAAATRLRQGLSFQAIKVIEPKTRAFRSNHQVVI